MDLLMPILAITLQILSWNYLCVHHYWWLRKENWRFWISSALNEPSCTDVYSGVTNCICFLVRNLAVDQQWWVKASTHTRRHQYACIQYTYIHVYNIYIYARTWYIWECLSWQHYALRLLLCLFEWYWVRQSIQHLLKGPASRIIPLLGGWSHLRSLDCMLYLKLLPCILYCIVYRNV